MRTRSIGLAFALAVMLGESAAGGQQPAPSARSLYERLGGVYSIAAVVDDFIDRLVANDTLNANPHIKEARDRVPASYLKYQVSALVCQVTGGPCTYTGRPLGVAHKGLGIAGADWDVFQKHLGAALDHLSIGAREKGELLDLVARYKADVVEQP